LQAHELGDRLLRAFSTINDPPSHGTVLPALAAQAIANAAGREFPAMITIWAARAAGQPSSVTVDAGATWLGLYLAAKILDDIQDGDAGLLPPDVPASTGTNLALALIFSALSCLSEPETCDPALYLQMAACTARSALRTIAGQQMGVEDTPDREHLLERAWQQAREKGGRPFALACRLGALSVGAAPEVVDGLEEFGQLLGEAVQALDDGLDLEKALPRELADPRQSLAGAYAFSVADDNDLAELHRHRYGIGAGDAGALAGMKAKLIEMGALRYLAVERSARVIKARALLARLGPRLEAAGLDRLSTVTEWLAPRAGRGA
jgi:hypothetical protein